MFTHDRLRYKILCTVSRGTQKSTVLDSLDCTPLEADALLNNLTCEGYIRCASGSYTVTSYGIEYRLALKDALEEEARREAYVKQKDEQEKAEHKKDRWNDVFVLFLGSLLSNLDRLFPYLVSLFR